MNSLFAMLTAFLLTAGQWTPVDFQQFWIIPNTGSILRFETQPENETGPEQQKGSSEEYIVYDTEDKIAAQGKAVRTGNRIEFSVKLPIGYYEIEFPKTKQRFGLASTDLPDLSKGAKPDPFFAIDGALSWLVSRNDVREELIRSAQKIGIGMIRERVNWGELEPREGVHNWEGNRRYERLRKYYRTSGIDVLELFHNSPNWTGLIEKRYPDDLVKTARSWSQIAKRWGSCWGAIEIWNEPDISFGGHLPSDQYVPVLKTCYWRFKQDGVKAPVVGAVVSGFNSQWMKTAADSRLLEYCDYFSYHTYNRADRIENLFKKYQDWFAANGHPAIPVWITECGRPWKKGPGRAGRQEDLASAIDIVMKGCEARASGIDRYFPFVYPYYEERQNNFGMTGKDGSPLRSIAAYARMIQRISGTEYIGDLTPVINNAVKQRVFRHRSGKKIVVLYNPKPKENSIIKLPFIPDFAEKVTGEKVKEISGGFDFSDGFLYVGIPDSAPVEITADTVPMKMLIQRKEAKQQEDLSRSARPQNASPVIFRYDFDPKTIKYNSAQYMIEPNAPFDLSLTISAFNLDQKTHETDISAAGGIDGALKPFSKKISHLPGERKTFSISINTRRVSELRPLELKLTGITDSKTESLALVFKRSISVDQATPEKLANYVEELEKIEIGDLKKWKKNHPSWCKMSFLSGSGLTSGAVWGIDCTFGEGDRWVYPCLMLDRHDLAKWSGVIIKIRAESDSDNVQIRLMADEESKESWMTKDSIIKADGKWQLAFIPFSQFGAFGNIQNDVFDRQITSFKIGGNTKGEKLRIEVSDFWFYR